MSLQYRQLLQQLNQQEKPQLLFLLQFMLLHKLEEAKNLQPIKYPLELVALAIPRPRTRAHQWEQTSEQEMKGRSLAKAAAVIYPTRQREELQL